MEYLKVIGQAFVIAMQALAVALALGWFLAAYTLYTGA